MSFFNFDITKERKKKCDSKHFVCVLDKLLKGPRYFLTPKLLKNQSLLAAPESARVLGQLTFKRFGEASGSPCFRRQCVSCFNHHTHAPLHFPSYSRKRSGKFASFSLVIATQNLFTYTLLTRPPKSSHYQW